MIKLVALCVVALVAVFVGKVAFDDGYAVHLFAESGYWFVCANFVCFLACLYLAYQSRWAELRMNIRWVSVCLAALVVLASTLFVSRAEPMGFKTVMDEHLIASTAQGLHLKRDATASMRFHYANNRPLLLENKVDKRPIFFPFLVSLVHDAFGYHPENSIRLNVYVLCPLLFILLYVLGNRLGGAWGGGLLCLLIATVPLCGFIFRGGGLELLNLVMLVAVLLLAMDFWKSPTVWSFGAFCMATTLLAQVRYESVIFVLPVAMICALQWWREKQLVIYWPLFLAPVFLIPYLWQNRVFEMNDVLWQLQGKASPFALEYLPDNLARCIYYYFNFDGSVGNSWLLAFVGVIACVCLCVILVRVVRERRSGMIDHPYTALIVYVPAYAVLFLVLLCFSWDFGGPVVQRLSLPLDLFLAVSSVVFLVSLDLKKPKVRVAVVACAFTYVVGYATPVSSQRGYNMGVGWWEYEMIHSLFEDGELSSDAIYITENASFFSVYRYSCSSKKSANARKQQIVNYMALPGAKPIYVMMRMTYDPEKDQYFDEGFSNVDDDFEMEFDREWALSPSRQLTFFRLVGIRGYEVEERSYDSLFEYQLDCLRMLP